MRLPEHVFNVVQDVCDEYPYPVVVDSTHLGEILNEIAWRVRGEGWGLSRKNGGTNVYSPVGYIAEDILQLPDGNHFDVLQGAGEGLPLNPVRGNTLGIINLKDRPWVAPVNFIPSWMTSIANPVPFPEVPFLTECKFTPAQCKCNCTPEVGVIEAVQSLRNRVDELAAFFDGHLNDALVRLDRNYNK